MTAPIKLMFEPDEPRTCITCGETKPAYEFEHCNGKVIMGVRRVYLRRECRKCRGKYYIPGPPKPKLLRLALDPPSGIPIYNPGWGLHGVYRR